MTAPVFRLCFSNAVDDYLAALDREHSSIVRVLPGHDDRGVLNVCSLPNATVDQIFDYVNTYQEDLHLFR